MAKAASVQLQGHKAFIFIASVSPVCPEPSNHDVLNALITAWVFANQPWLNSVRQVVPVLYDGMGRIVSIPFDEDLVDHWLTAALPVAENPVAMPSPLAAFLVRRTRHFLSGEKVFQFRSLIYCKSENSP